MKRNIAIIEQMISPIDFRNAFISIPLNILDIEPEKKTNIDISEEFNISI